MIPGRRRDATGLGLRLSGGVLVGSPGLSLRQGGSDDRGAATPSIGRQPSSKRAGLDTCYRTAAPTSVGCPNGAYERLVTLRCVSFHAAVSMMALPEGRTVMAYSFGFSVGPWPALATPGGVDSMFQVPHGLLPSENHPLNGFRMRPVARP